MLPQSVDHIVLSIVSYHISNVRGEMVSVCVEFLPLFRLPRSYFFNKHYYAVWKVLISVFDRVIEEVTHCVVILQKK